MDNDDNARAAASERLSALVDGELDASAVQLACAHWRGDAGARALWHASHLIGDVLRSEDLAQDPAHDRQFIERLRERLAGEPVVLAPSPAAAVAAAQRPGGRGWMLPSALAAGFVAIAGVLVVLRAPDLPTGAAAPDLVARTEAPAAQRDARVPAAATVAASEPATLVVTGGLIRDAQLDRYLTAHKQFAGSSALGAPSAFLRNATAAVPER